MSDRFGIILDGIERTNTATGLTDLQLGDNP